MQLTRFLAENEDPVSLPRSSWTKRIGILPTVVSKCRSSISLMRGASVVRTSSLSVKPWSNNCTPVW